MGDEPSVRSIVVGLLMNTMIYWFSQEKATKKPDASNEPPGATVQPEAGPSNAPDETKPTPTNAPTEMQPESSGMQHEVQVRFHSVHLQVETHAHSYSPDEEDHSRTTLISPWPFRSRYHRGCVAAVQVIMTDKLGRSSCGHRSRCLLWAIPIGCHF